LEEEDAYCCKALSSLQELSDELHREMRSSTAESRQRDDPKKDTRFLGSVVII